MKIRFSIDVDVDVPESDTRQKQFCASVGGRTVMSEFEHNLPSEWKAVLAQSLKDCTLTPSRL